MRPVHTVVSGRWKQNCFVVADPSGAALVIDPGGEADAIVDLVERLGLHPVAIVNTHGHYDHVGAVAELRARFGIPFHLHSGDVRLLRQANLYRMVFDGERSVVVPQVDGDLADVAVLEVGPFSVEVVPAPGHTPGSVVLLLDGAAFVGDLVLFAEVGRADLPGGSPNELGASFDRLCALPPDTVVHPGHGGSFLVRDILRGGTNVRAGAGS